MSKFIFPSLSSLLYVSWSSVSPCRVYKIEWRSNIPREHVYGVVFSLSQEEQYQWIMSNPEVNILYDAPWAYNKVHGGNKNQQKFVLFEFK